MADAERDRWEVRTPLAYGTEHYIYIYGAARAQAVADLISKKLFGDSGLQIHTKSRIIYINDDDDR